MKNLFNELALAFALMNCLMKKGLISYKEARKIIWESLPMDMPEDKKEAIINSMVKE